MLWGDNSDFEQANAQIPINIHGGNWDLAARINSFYGYQRYAIISLIGLIITGIFYLLHWKHQQNQRMLRNQSLLQHQQLELEKKVNQRTQEYQEAMHSLKLTDKLTTETLETYRGLFEGSQDAVMLADESGIVNCNQQSLKMFACPEKTSILGLTPWSLSPKEQPDGSNSEQQAKLLLHKAMRNEGTLFEWVHKKMDGTEFFSEVLLSPVTWQGKPVVQAVVRNIDARKKN